MPEVRSPEAIARRNVCRAQRLKAQRERERGDRPARPRLPTDPVERAAFELQRKRTKLEAAPFVGCDGEGIGHDGEEKYVLLRIGDRELYRGGRRLTTPECLTFILQSPPRDEALLIAFAFDYDATNILLDVPMKRERHDVPSRMQRLLHLDNDDGTTDFKNPWTWLNFDGYPEFGVMYLPRHYLKVCYCDIWYDEKGKAHRHSRNSSTRIIEDGFGFFQTSFLRALNQWQIGEEHWPLIKRMKARRARFERISDKIREYNKLECELLAQLMEALRKASYDAGIWLKQWDGAGRIATSMLKTNGLLSRKQLEGKLQAGLIDMAHAAYYGGRAEVTRIGDIGEPIVECDISSAYPAALQQAPCHRHGKWRKVSATVLQAHMTRRSKALFVAPVEFSHPRDTFLCGLPFRLPSGALMWPRHGRGTYWSPELRSALQLGARVHIRGPGWLYVKQCDCAPYGFLNHAYEARRALGKASKGVVLKLGTNAVYGKVVQRVGGAPWLDPIVGGLATAITRAALNAAIAAAGPRNIIMIATDAIYAVGQGENGPALDYGAGLGQWERKQHRRLFIVKPGLYWPPRTKGWKLKTRGLPVKFFEPMVPRFVEAWSDYLTLRRRSEISDRYVMGPRPPVVPVTITVFIGLRLAFHRNEFGLAGRWIKTVQQHSFDWHDKRHSASRLDGRSLILDSKEGDAFAQSLVYSRAVKPEGVTESDWKKARELFESMPDYVDLSIPHRLG